MLLSNLAMTQRIKEIKHAVFWPDSSCYKEIREYFNIGLPSMMIMLFEGFAWHIMAFVAGYFGSTAQAS